MCSLENWWLRLHELDKLDLNSGESEAVGKADSVLRRAEGPRGCGSSGTRVSLQQLHKASLLLLHLRESTSQWHIAFNRRHLYMGLFSVD